MRRQNLALRKNIELSVSFMMWYSTILSAAALLSIPFASGYANPGPCSGTCTNTADPSVIRRSSDGTYFRFSTGGKIAIYSAPAITGPWTYKCAMLPSGSSINLAGNDDLWAPDVSLHGKTYYIYYAVSTFGVQNSAIGLATSDTMDCGSFTDHGATGIASVTGSAYNTIDPHLFTDGHKKWMNFGSFWSDIYQIPMAATPTKPSGASYQIEFDPSGTHPSEGSYMVKYGGYYYLFYSSGICCGYDTSRPAPGAEYKIKVCRSGSATGSFVSLLDRPLPLGNH